MYRKTRCNQSGGLRRSGRLKMALRAAKIPRRSARILGLESSSINFRAERKIVDPRKSNKALVKIGKRDASMSSGQDCCTSNDEPCELDNFRATTKTLFFSCIESSENGSRDDVKSAMVSDMPEEFIGKREENDDRHYHIKAKKRRRTEGEDGRRNVNLNKGKKAQYCSDDSATDDGWTKDQELALQNAYFGARPSPHFWKRVSKMVAGKSEQECFDKIQSDYITPLQNPGRPRINKGEKLRSKPIPVGDLLKPATPMRGRRFAKNKYLLRCNTVRDLINKHYLENRDEEADLFSVLEEDDDARGGVGGDCVSFRSSPGMMMVVMEEKESVGSPDVLKEMKDWCGHRRYISQLQSREATRAAAHRRKAASGEDGRDGEEVKASKNSLVLGARDVIQLFQFKQDSDSEDEYEEEEDDDDGDDE